MVAHQARPGAVLTICSGPEPGVMVPGGTVTGGTVTGGTVTGGTVTGPGGSVSSLSAASASRTASASWEYRCSPSRR
jgi:hypothetical protein